MPKLKPNQKLTIKEARAVKAFIETGNQSQAVLDAGYDTTNANNMGSQIFNKPRVKLAVEQAMNKLGITPEKILARFDKMAESSRNDVVKVRSNENLAQLADMYPDKNPLIDANGSTLNISWGE